MKKTLISVTLIFAIILGCNKEQKEITTLEEVVATVNKDRITAIEFEKELRYRGLVPSELIFYNEVQAQALKMSILDEFINEKLILQEAEKRNIALDKAEIDSEIDKIKNNYSNDAFEKMISHDYLSFDAWKDELSEDLLIKKMIIEELKNKIDIKEDDLRAYYDSHIGEFEVEESVRARQIVVGSMQEALNILKSLRSGADFETLARKNSLSPDSASGGDLGYFGRGEMPPEFEDVCFSLKEGEVSSIIQSPYGFHIFKVEDRLESRLLGFIEAKNDIYKKIREEKEKKIYDFWIEELRDKAKIKVNEKILKEVGMN